MKPILNCVAAVALVALACLPSQAKECAEQVAKLKACDQLKWAAKAVCRKLADKKACLGL